MANSIDHRLPSFRRVWDHLVQERLRSSTLSVCISFIAIPAATFIVDLLIQIFRRKPDISVSEVVTGTLWPTIGSAFITAIVWTILLGWSFVRVVGKDKESLIEKSAEKDKYIQQIGEIMGKRAAESATAINNHARTILERDERIRQMGGQLSLTEGQLYEVRTQLAAANEKIAEKTNEISLLNQIPADIEVEILEVQRRAIDSQQEGVKSWKYDIFVRAKLELKNLGSIAISQMRVELSLQGALEIPQEKRDIESWRLFISRKIDGGAGYAYHRIKPVKEELTQGVPEEGWLHYVTNRTTDEELDGSSLKLIVETSRGASHAELDAHTSKWSPWGSGRIVPDPDTTNIGLPNIGE
jgi:hypothetical protein